MAHSELIAESALLGAGGWFLRSGIQESSGGVARYHRADLGTNLSISTEITGYAVSTLCFLYSRTREPAYLEAAQRAADYLTKTAWNSALGIFPFELPLSRTPGKPDDNELLAYAFDTGIIVRGLLALWRITREPKLLGMAVLGGESLARHFVAGNEMYPVLRLPSLEALPYTGQWSRSPGCYQLKSALCWNDLARVTGRGDFADLYSGAVVNAISSSSFFLPAETPVRTMDRLHAYCYYLEGLLPLADQEDVRLALRSGIERTARYLREIRSEFERSDVNAQLLRVRLLAHRAGAVELDYPQADEEADRIAEFQIEPGGNAAPGGYWFGRKVGCIIPHPNPVSTAFALQAIEMWHDFCNGLPLDLPSLI